MPAERAAIALKRRLVSAATVAILVVAVSVAFRPVASQAFTLIGCGTSSKVTVSPTSGLKSAALRADGLCSPAPCGQVLTFNFYWDTTATQFWSQVISVCNAARNYDTGPSPAFVPPAADNAIGAHTVLLKVLTAAGGPAANGSHSAAYTINSPPPPPPPPPPPRPTPTPTPKPTPTPDCSATPPPAGCPSPTAKACPAAMLPPAGTGGWADNLIAALMVGAALPIVGLAMFGPQTLLAAAYRRRRFLTLFGLSALAVLALNCTFPTASTSQPTPGVAATPSPTPTPSGCSA